MRRGGQTTPRPYTSRPIGARAVYNSTPAGQLTLAGTHATSQTVHPAGKITLTGTANSQLIIKGGTSTPTGTILLAGTTTSTLQIVVHPAGKITLTGYTFSQLQLTSQPAGQITLNGQSASSYQIIAQPAGQIVLSGTLHDYTLQTRQITVRERPPLRLAANITTPAGVHARWGNDDPRPSNTLSALTFTTSIPGGFQDATLTLQRDPRKNYPDLELLSTITITGAGGRVAWQGRVEQLPDVGGDQAQINPQCAGWQNHLKDDDSAREVFVDRSITAWQGPSVSRQIQWLKLGASPSGASVAPDYTNGYPSLDAELQGAWSQNQIVEGWYDAHGIPLGLLYAAWETNGAYTLTGGDQFGAAMFLATDDTGTVYDQFNPITAAPGQHALAATQPNRSWGLLQFWNDTIPGGQDGVNYDLYWTALGVYGNHGLPLYGATGQTQAWGLLASDCIGYMLARWAPKIAYTTGPRGSIQPSTFVLPQLVFLDPTTVAAMLAQAVSYELLDWAVWEEPQGIFPCQPCFYLNTLGARGSQWRARTGPAQLQDTGQQINNLYNGVIVVWTDVSGVNRSVGPPGSDANYTSSVLADPNPGNPANQAGVNRWGLVTMGTSTLAGATQLGQVFLAQQRLLNSSGQATLTGYVEDPYGVNWPAWMVRAGDTISFIDAADTTPRRIVSTSYDDTAKTNTLQLDQPPDALDALLARLSVVLQPIGLS